MIEITVAEKNLAILLLGSKRSTSEKNPYEAIDSSCRLGTRKNNKAENIAKINNNNIRLKLSVNDGEAIKFKTIITIATLPIHRKAVSNACFCGNV